jgi:hypothetical protein
MTEETQNDSVVILQLETMKRNYEALLTEYIQTQKDYNTYLTTTAGTDASSNLVTSDGYSFYGSKPLTTSNSVSQDECTALCSTLDGCSGGTYNATTSTCMLVSGTGPMNKGVAGQDVAIISEDKMYLEKMQVLNHQLTELNQDILAQISAGKSTYDTENALRQTQSEVLQTNYDTLNIDEEAIKKSLREIDSATQAQNYTKLQATSAYFGFYFMLCLVLNMLIILMSANGGNQIAFSSLILVFILEILVFLIFIRPSTFP